MNIELTENNLFIYAAKHYYNPKFIDEESFEEDLKRFKYVKRLCNRYLETGKLSERLLLNHLIIVFNVFGIEPAKNILGLKLDKEHWTIIKPFLIYLNYITNNEYIEIDMDQTVIDALRKI